MDQLRSLVPTMTAADEHRIHSMLGTNSLTSFPELLKLMVEELTYYYDEQ